MATFLGYMVNALVLGSEYALFAAGLAVLFGVVRVFNFAHGLIFVSGGFILYWLTQEGITSLWLAVPLAGILGGLAAGTALEYLVLGPTRRRQALPFIEALATIGFATAGLGLIDVIAGGDPLPINVHQSTLGHLGPATISTTSTTTIGGAVLVLGTLAVWLRRSRFGLALRATADSRADVELLGYDSGHILSGAVIIGSVLAALAGALVVAYLGTVQSRVGENLLVNGVAMVVVGGMGSIYGAVLVAYVVGIGETLTVGYIGSVWRPTTALALLLGIMLVRPNGLFGRTDVERL